MNEFAGSIIRQKSLSISSDQEQERHWIADSQRGDTRAFNRLVLRWEKRVYNVAFRILKEREEAAEATQDAFLLAFKSIGRFRNDAKFSTWIFRIAVNLCLTRIRQRPPGIYYSIEDESGPESPLPQLRVAETQTGELMRREQRKRILGAIGHLSPDQRAVIELKFFEELTFDEIAEILEVPPSTIKSRLYSGLELLRIRLGSDEA